MLNDHRGDYITHRITGFSLALVSGLFLVHFKTDESNLAEKIVYASVLFVVMFPLTGYQK